MYVCLCNAITDGQIRQFVSKQSQDVKMSELRSCLGVCGQCGKCGKHAQTILKQCQNNLNE